MMTCNHDDSDNPFGELTPEMRAYLEKGAANGSENARQVLGMHNGDVDDVIRWLAANSAEFAMPREEVEAFLAELEEDDV